MITRERLNYKKDGFYSIQDEKKVLSNGRYEGFLIHGNVKHESILIFSDKGLSGDRVVDFSLSTFSEKDWKTYINIFSEHEEVYITYESKGDTVDAEDINSIVDYTKNLKKEVDDKVDKQEGKQLSTNDFTDEDKNKLKGIENGANKIDKISQLENDKGFIIGSDVDFSDIEESIKLLDRNKLDKSAVENGVSWGDLKGV